MPDKSSVSKASTYQGIGEFWDEHDASEVGVQRSVEFTVNIQSERRYYPIDSKFSSVIAYSDAFRTPIPIHSGQ